jgi:DnaJ-class molecular chaperone
LNPNDKEAERKFKELNEANEVLSSTENRKKYDDDGENWQNAEQYEQSKDNSNTTNEVDNKLISVAVERIIRTLNLCLAGAPQGGGRRSANLRDRILMLNSILT